MPTPSSRPSETEPLPPPARRFWAPRSAPGAILLSAFGAALLAVLFFCPRFWLWPAAGLPLGEFTAIQPEFHRAFHALQQLQDPWRRVDDAVNRVIEWRLFWPVLAHYGGLAPSAYLALPPLGCLLALGAVATVTWQATRAMIPTLGATFLAATSSWFFVSTGWLAYFDSWLILALVLAGFARSRWVLSAAALLAPWIDERFILALPVCLAVRAIAADRAAPPERGELIRDGLALLAGVAPYLALRLGAEITGSRATSQSYWADRPLLPAPLPAMLWGGWNGLRLGWIPIGLATVAAFRAGCGRGPWSVALAATAVSLVVADDISRSASVAVPALLAALLLAWRAQPDRMRTTLAWLCAGNLLLPAQHVIAAPGTAVKYHCLPILTAHAEYERTLHPPEFASTATYLRRSTDHLQNNQLERAMAAAEIALRFDPDSAKALANHGILQFVLGRREAGLAELNRALARAPELYDARLQRSAFRQQAGDLRGALDDVRLALQSMPADWPRRKEAEAYERALAAQAGR